MDKDFLVREEQKLLQGWGGSNVQVGNYSGDYGFLLPEFRALFFCSADCFGCPRGLCALNVLAIWFWQLRHVPAMVFVAVIEVEVFGFIEQFIFSARIMTAALYAGCSRLAIVACIDRRWEG